MRRPRGRQTHGARARARLSLSRCHASSCPPRLTRWAPRGRVCAQLLELLRKVTLTGFLLTTPQQLTLLRLVIALLLTIAHMILLQAAAPYKQASTAFLAVTFSLTLTLTFFAALLLKIYAELTPEQSEDLFGLSSAFLLTVVILIFNLSVLLTAFAMLVVRLEAERKQLAKRRLRYVSSAAEVEPPPLPPGGYHLFLSHCWSAGQDMMRVVKQRLRELAPAFQVFLDVDDLEDISDLEGYVDRSSTVLIFCTAGYADSRNCMRELRRAVQQGKPLIALLEPEARRGGVTEEGMRSQLIAAEECRAASGEASGPGTPSRRADDSTPRSGAELADALFAQEAIEWNRLGAFQDVSDSIS